MCGLHLTVYGRGGNRQYQGKKKGPMGPLTQSTELCQCASSFIKGLSAR